MTTNPNETENTTMPNDRENAILDALEILEQAHNYTIHTLLFDLQHDHRSDDDTDYVTACTDLYTDLTRAHHADDRDEIIYAMRALRTCDYDAMHSLFPTACYTPNTCIHDTPLPFDLTIAPYATCPHRPADEPFFTHAITNN